MAIGYAKFASAFQKRKFQKQTLFFQEVHRINKKAESDSGVLRISTDTKATVRVGPFSRHGSNRQGDDACDHDFNPDEKLVPFGILVPETGQNHLWFAQSRVTADFMVDRLNEMIPRWKKDHGMHTLVINADNGSESNGRRTQWLKRLVELADQHQLTIQLAYYPPYHSKYNPIERVWGVLENHWRGEILNTVEKTLGLARTMSYRGIKPTVRKVTKIYHKGISVAKRAMRSIEARLERTNDLEDWFIKIVPQPQTG